jgi:hypothetical protein
LLAFAFHINITFPFSHTRIFVRSGIEGVLDSELMNDSCKNLPTILINLADATLAKIWNIFSSTLGTHLVIHCESIAWQPVNLAKFG